jgi:cytochrome c oxidase subunit 2
MLKPETVIAGLGLLVLGLAGSIFLAMEVVVGRGAWILYKMDEEVREVAQADEQVRVWVSKSQWLFHYPGEDGVFGKTDREQVSDENPIGLDPTDATGAGADDHYSKELVLPTGVSTGMVLESLDVIHCLSGLEAGQEVDVIPGITARALITARSKPESGRVRCVQLCGPGHLNLHAGFRFVSRSDFERWLAAERTR